MSSMKNKSLAIIGMGNIGRILIRRLMEDHFPVDKLVICDVDYQRGSDIAADFGVRVVSLTDEAAWGSDLILIAASPKAVPEIVEDLAPRLSAGQILVSFAAAISLNRLEKLIPEGVVIVRVLPNAPSLVGQGINPVSYGSRINLECRALIQELLAILGKSVTVLDEQMNWCVGLTGAAMRSLLPVLEGMTAAGVEAGFTEKDASILAAQVMMGTASLVLQTDLSFEQIKSLTPMKTVDETELWGIFYSAACQVKAKMDRFQQKLEA